MDASTRAADGSVVLLPFSEQDPFVPVYGDISEDRQAIAQGHLFAINPAEEIVLEPGEAVDTDMAFPLRSSDVGLLAMQVRIQGYQRRGILGHRMRGRLWVWASFFYVDTGTLTPEAISPGWGGRKGTEGPIA